MVQEKEETLAKDIVNRKLETIRTAKEQAALLKQKADDQFVRRPKLFLHYYL
jgi:hypothetical protein